MLLKTFILQGQAVHWVRGRNTPWTGRQLLTHSEVSANFGDCVRKVENLQPQNWSTSDGFTFAQSGISSNFLFIYL